MRNLAVLASGSGSNFEALAHASRRGELPGRIVVLLCDQPDAPVVERARRLAVEFLCPPAGAYRTRLTDERPWIEALVSRGVDTILLAGFMRRLHGAFLGAYPERILNIHPSLLPAFPGRHAIRDAWEHGVGVTGCTVHLVTDEVDGGPIIAQQALPIRDGEPLEELERRMHQAEHTLYAAAARRFLTEGWRREGRRIVFDTPQAAWTGRTES